MVLSWLRFRNATQGVPAWITAERAPLSGDQFRLDIRSPPPPDALIPASSIVQPDGQPADGTFAVGVLSAVMLAPGAAFDWTNTLADPPTAVAVAHDRATLLVYRSGTSSFRVLDFEFEDLQVPRGFSRLEAMVPGAAGETYFPKGLDDAELWPDGGLPNWEFCQDRVPSQAVSVEYDGRELPPSDTVRCACEPRPAFYETQCAQAFGVLCQQCFRERIVAPDPMPEDWPCVPEGRSCGAPEEYFCGPDGLPYECVDGAWRVVGDDCDRTCVEG